jgi:hypothetical protein
MQGLEAACVLGSSSSVTKPSADVVTGVFKSRHMASDYDIFEKLPDGRVIWRFAVIGRDIAVAQFEQIAAISANEVFVVQVDTQEVILRKIALAHRRWEGNLLQ